jgi:hypothetical protein
MVGQECHYPQIEGCAKNDQVRPEQLMRDRTDYRYHSPEVRYQITVHREESSSHLFDLVGNLLSARHLLGQMLLTLQAINLRPDPGQIILAFGKTFDKHSGWFLGLLDGVQDVVTADDQLLLFSLILGQALFATPVISHSVLHSINESVRSTIKGQQPVADRLADLAMDQGA